MSISARIYFRKDAGIKVKGKNRKLNLNGIYKLVACADDHLLNKNTHSELREYTNRSKAD